MDCRLACILKKPCLELPKLLLHMASIASSCLELQASSGLFSFMAIEFARFAYQKYSNTIYDVAGGARNRQEESISGQCIISRGWPTGLPESHQDFWRQFWRASSV